MEIYMINKGSQYTLFYNASKTIESKIAKNIQYIKDPVDLGDRIENALMGFIWKAEKGMDKIGEKLRTRVSSILHKAATEKEVNLNYAHTLEEKAARYNFGRIVKKDRIKGNLILGAGTIIFAASMVTPLFFVPTISTVSGIVVGYQIGMIRNQKKGLQNISFVSSPEVTKLERIIAGEQGLGLTNPGLIDYKVAKGL